MKTKKKRNRIILCLCSIFVLVASIFSFIPLAKDTHIVKADSVSSDYSFNGSNLSSKTTFTKGLFSYNLFNPNNTLIGGFYSSADGVFRGYSDGVYGRYLTHKNLIPVESGKYIYASCNSTIAYVSHLIFFNNGVFVSSLNSPYGVIPTNANQVAFNIINPATDGVVTPSDVSDIQLTYSSSILPYVPYQNSTQVNFEFDFSSIYDFDYEWSRIDIKFNINSNLDFARVSNNNYQSIQGDGKSYSFTTNTTGAVTQLTFSAINKETNVLDNNYIFRIYTFLDYIDNENYNPATYFTANIGSIVLGSYKDYATYFRNDYSLNTTFLKTGKYNFISYVDNNNNNLNFLIPLDSDNDSDYWQFRTYYTSNASVDTSGAYNNGYNQGYNSGYGVGKQSGYDNGYITGKNDGYNLGYNTALENDQYTFTNLISAVIDVPVKAFTSLFNFEILGVNLSGFFLGLLTCCIVICVIRLIL